MKIRNRKYWQKVATALISLSVLSGVCALLFPLPFVATPRNAGEKDLSQPFPCQHRSCGCRSADQCWKKCCCFTDQQKVAWAKKNNVKVPDFVVASAAKELASSRKNCPHCVVHENKGPDAGRSDEPENLSLVAMILNWASAAFSSNAPVSCSSDSNDSNEVVASTESSQSTFTGMQERSVKWVLAVSAAECSGQGPLWFCLPLALVPDRPVLSEISDAADGQTLTVESERLQKSSLAPPLPPPKIG